MTTRLWLMALMALVAAVMAGWYTRQAARATASEGQHMHQSLALTALHVMEQTEAGAARFEADHIDAAYVHAQQQAAQYNYQANVVDSYYQKREQRHGSVMSQLAQRDREEASAEWELVEETDEERLKLLQQLQDEKQALKQLHARENQTAAEQWTEGPCSWRLFQTVCTVVGGVTQLQQQQDPSEDELAAQVHRDLNQLADVRHREFMESLVAAALEQKAGRYQRAADACLQIAAAWHERADHDAQMAAKWNATSQELHQAALKWHDRLQAYQQAATRLSQAAQSLLQTAHAEERQSRVFSVTALCLALPCFVYYTWRALGKLLVVCHGWMATKHHDHHQESFLGGMWLLHYSLVHVMVFLTTACWCSGFVTAHLNAHHDYGNDTQQLEQRAAVILYYSFVAAMTQTILLHTLWHLYDEFCVITTARPLSSSPWNWRSIGGTLALVGKYAALRLVSLVPLFAMELLFVWLTPPAMRTWILHPSWRQAVWTHFLLVVTTVLYWNYYAALENSSGASTILDGQSTVLLLTPSDEDPQQQQQHSGEESSSSAAPTEHTPLDMGATTYSPTTTDIVPHLYLSGVEETATQHRQLETSSHYSLHSDSPHYVCLRDELFKLLLPFELLASFCALLMINLALDNLFGDIAMYILCFVLVLMGCLWYVGSVMHQGGDSGNDRVWWGSFCPNTRSSAMNEDDEDNTPPKFLYI